MPRKISAPLTLGAIYIVLAFLANTTQSVFGKFLGAQLSVEMFTWVTFLSALIIVLPIAGLRGFRDLPTKAGWFHLLRGVTGITGFFLFIAAAQLTSLVNANVLLNTTPIFIPILAMLFLGQNIRKTIWLAIGLGFAGMVIVVKPDASLFTNPGNLVALAAGFATAIEFLAVKRLDETDSPITQMFYFLLIGAICSTFATLGKFQAISAQQALILIATGACLVAFQFLLIKAYVYAEPHEIGAFQYSSVIFAAIFGWTLFKESIDLGTIMGTLLICIGGVMSITGRTEQS
jgi:drug/metabolite transporter (DMT)-like permease